MNPRVLSKLLLLSLFLAAPAALAQAPVQGDSKASEDLPFQGSGFSFSARVGGALPLGLAAGGDGHTELRMKDIVSGMIPVQLDGGLFLGSSVYLGAYLQYGRLLLAQDCPESASCSATDLRFGLNVSFHLPVSGRWSPWLGGGVGYELFKPGNRTLNGVDFNLQGGADFHVSGPVWAGPCVMFTRGAYLNVNDPEPHYWLMGGLKLMMRH